MNHLKTYQSEDYYIHDKQFVIEGPLTHEDLKALTFDAHLTAFRDAEDQYEALLEITTLPEGRILCCSPRSTHCGLRHFPLS